MRRVLSGFLGSTLQASAASHPAAVGSSCKGAPAACLQLATEALLGAPGPLSSVPCSGIGRDRTPGNSIGCSDSSGSSSNGSSSGSGDWGRSGASGQLPPLHSNTLHDITAASHLHAAALSLGDGSGSSVPRSEPGQYSSSSLYTHTPREAPPAPPHALTRPALRTSAALAAAAATATAAATAAAAASLSPLSSTASIPLSASAFDATAAAFASSSASAMAASASVSSFAAASPGEPSLALAAVQQLANGYEALHAGSGLPWAAVIPAVTLALRLALLPLSMRQARIIRTNYSLYKEALTLTAAQEAEAAAAAQLAEGEAGRQQRHATWQVQGHGQAQEAGSVPGAGGGGGDGAAGALVGPSPGSAAASAVEKKEADLRAKLLRSQAVLSNFHLLRAKVGAPHPGWLVVNPLVQVPLFVGVSTTLGIMCRLPWPGLESEGLLWFPNLTLPAMVFPADGPFGAAGFVDASSPAYAAATAAAAEAAAAATEAATAYASAGVGGFPGVGATADLVAAATAANEVLLPMGTNGLLLPLIVYGMTMSSLRLGFGAAGAAAAQSPDIRGTALGALLHSLPPLLYCLATANLYLKAQMAHGVLLHWATSAGFTLGLQTALRNPTLRTWLKLNPGQQGGAAAPAPAAGPATATAATGATAATAAGRSYADLPTELVARVAETSDPNVLVIMGAQLSARQHYPGALHCFRKAVLLAPGHVRAHYSMGQVHSLTGAWPEAEAAYRAAAQLSPEGPERGQALYCVASALHSQGKFSEAAEAYAAADALWRGQAVVAFGRANALAASGRRQEALEAVAEAEARDAATPGRPFGAVLARLRAQLVMAGSGSDSGGGGGGSGGGGGDGTGSERGGSSSSSLG